MVPHWTWDRLSPTARAALSKTHNKRHARGLCSTCHSKHTKTGTLADFDPLRLTHQDIMEEYQILSRLGEGFTDRQIAARLDISPATLYRHLKKETND